MVFIFVYPHRVISTACHPLSAFISPTIIRFALKHLPYFFFQTPFFDGGGHALNYYIHGAHEEFKWAMV